MEARAKDNEFYWAEGNRAASGKRQPLVDTLKCEFRRYRNVCKQNLHLISTWITNSLYELTANSRFTSGAATDIQ